MAKSINFRAFNDGGDLIYFSSLKFRTEVDNYVRNKKEKGEKCTREEVYSRIAEITFVSVDAVKKWRAGHNGPSDLDTIKKIAAILETDISNITIRGDNRETKEIEQDFTPMYKEEKDLINQMYQLFVDYGYWFFGTDICYADKVLEDPIGEQQKYIINLYHFLDRIALLISQETYFKLRRIITQLEQVYSTIPVGIPVLWIKLNPLLGTESLMELFESNEEDLSGFFCVENDGDPREVLHMLYEDMPEYEKEYKKFLNDKRIKNKLQLLENSLPGQRNFYIDFPVYSLASRELCRTLYLVMEYFFPEYYKNNGVKK